MQPRGVPIRVRPARPGPVLLAGFLFLLGLPAALRAQGDRAVGEPFARGKPLSEWVSQATHYIPELRREAMRALAALGPGAAPALPVLVRGTRDESEDVRFWAVEALGRIGPGARSAAPALVVVMSDDVRRVQEAARRALEQIGPASAPVLLPALHAADPWLRANAAEALGTVAEPKREVVTALTRLLADDSLWVRASAAWAIGQLGEGARQAARPLAAALAEELRRDPALADHAVHVRVEHYTFALGRLGHHADDAVPLVLSVFHDGDDSLRASAAVALARLGKRAARPLGQALRAGPMPHRLEAARALRLMGPDAKDAVPDLVKVLEQTDELEGGRELVIASADALGAMGRNARDARRILERQRSRSTTPDVVAALERALRKIQYGG